MPRDSAGINPYVVLERKRFAEELTAEEIDAAVEGAATGSWDDAQIGAFLMAVAINGLSPGETGALTRAMLDSGEQWRLGERFPGLVDKHSTGGVGDKVSLILAPLLAACGVPVVMLTGRALGHTGGTADKLETVPGLRLDLEQDRCIDLLERHALAIGVATPGIAPADRRLYAVRDRTGTVSSLPLVVGSILSKKLATGAAALALDVKFGNGAVLSDPERARELASALVETANQLGMRTAALLTDMSQPLGEWSGHSCEVVEALEVLAGGGDDRLRTVSLELSLLAAELGGHALDREVLAAALADGRARERFLVWAVEQGASEKWAAKPRMKLAPHEVVVEAERDGVLAAVDTRDLGLLVQESSRDAAGRLLPDVSLRYRCRLGAVVSRGQELARLYLATPSAAAEARCERAFTVADDGDEPPIVHDRIG